MRTLTTEEEVIALPDRSVVILVDDDNGFLSTALYQKLGNHWIEMDPSDRYDGEYTWRDKDILVIAEREGAIAYVAFNPRTLKEDA